MVWLTREQARLLARCAAVFEPGDPARTGRVTFWDADGAPPPASPALPPAWPAAEPGEALLCTPQGPRTLPVLRLPVGEALPVLLTARREYGDGSGEGAQSGGGPHPAAAFWGAAAALALHLTARERVLPGVSAGGYDAWRVGPLDSEDVLRLRELAAAAPPEAFAAPVPGTELLPEPDGLLRAFLDAVADTLPRTAAAEAATERAAFAAAEPQHVPQLRAWADEISVGLDSGIRMTLHVVLDHAERGDDAERGEHPDRGGEAGKGGGSGRPSGSGPGVRIVPRVAGLGDPTLTLDAGELFDGAPHALGPRAQADTVLAVRRAADVWEPLRDLLPIPRELVLGDREISQLLGEVAPRLRARGIDVRWPAEVAGSLVARAVVGADCAPPTDLRSFMGADGRVDLRWRLYLDGEALTEQECAAVAEGSRPLVALRGRWVFVDADLARKARTRELKPLTAIEALAVALGGFAEIGGEQVPVEPSPWLTALRAKLADPDGGTEPVAPPAALAATLRDYQLRGLRWLDRMTSLGLGGCLADDMGLGKTIQLIALHLRRQEHEASRGPTLVVCPASLLGNWEREVNRFAPGTEVRRFHGTGRDLEGASSGFVLTTYGTMRLDADRLAVHPWSMVVADEAQHVKNPASATARALRHIPADARVALTGTPVENSLFELWAVLDWTTPGLLGTHARFRRRWAAPVEAERADPPEERHTAARLATLVRPFLLRRRKSDPGIAPELPPKTETDRPVALTSEQRALYERRVHDVMAEIRATEGIARSGLVLKLLTGLKQICNHPAQFLKEDPGDEALRLTGRSAKLDLLDELVDTITSEDGAVLVFTQYVAMARLLERHLADRGVPALLLHGGTPVPRREQLVRRFQDGEVPVFLLSLKAAGTGLNLTRADHVVHYDRWWNPAVEAQATDRAYRIGQTRPVQVHRMIAEGTVEDRIAALLESKRELADAVLGSGEQALSKLDNDELANLVELRNA